MAEFGINSASFVGAECGRTRKGDAYLKFHIECGKKAKGEPRIFQKFMFQPREGLDEYMKDIYSVLEYVVGRDRAKAGIAANYMKGQKIDYFLNAVQKTWTGRKSCDLLLHYEEKPRKDATRTYLTVGDDHGAWWDKPRRVIWHPQVQWDEEPGLIFVDWATGQVHPTFSRPNWWVKKGFCEPRGVVVKEAR